MVNCLPGCIKVKETNYFQGVMIVDIVYFTVEVLLALFKSKFELLRNPEIIFIMAIDLAFFVSASFSLAIYLRKERFNTIWHKVYFVARQIIVIICLFNYGAIICQLIYILTEKDLESIFKGIGLLLFEYVMLFLLYVYIMFIGVNLLKLGFKSTSRYVSVRPYI